MGTMVHCIAFGAIWQEFLLVRRAELQEIWLEMGSMVRTALGAQLQEIIVKILPRAQQREIWLKGKAILIVVGNMESWRNGLRCRARRARTRKLRVRIHGLKLIHPTSRKLRKLGTTLLDPTTLDSSAAAEAQTEYDI